VGEGEADGVGVVDGIGDATAQPLTGRSEYAPAPASGIKTPVGSHTV
jgi:hypothetical protein